MGTVLANSFPSSPSNVIIPNTPVTLGLRTTAADERVLLNGFNVFYGHSNIKSHSILPEDDWQLAYCSSIATLVPVENALSDDTKASRIISSGQLVITKNSDTTDNTQCVYEVATESVTGSPMAYFRLSVDPAWARMHPFWCTIPSVSQGNQKVVAPYLALENGKYNSACYVFLREASPGVGSIVVGGVLQAFGVTRPQHHEFAVDWLDAAFLTAGGQLEVWIYYNELGYNGSFPDPDVPVIEVWTRRLGVDSTPVCHTLGSSLTILPSNSMGHFPKPGEGTNNTRVGVTNIARLSVGNAGEYGDALRVLSWALYPSVDFAVREGVPQVGHLESISPDSPHVYKTSSKLLLTEGASAWSASNIGNQKPKYAPGRSDYPQSITLIPPNILSREEPRLAVRSSGASVEALLSASVDTPTGDVDAGDSGVGISFSDGQYEYRVNLVRSFAGYTVGVAKPPTGTALVDKYYLAAATYDWRTPLQVRMVLDRLRNVLNVYVDQALALSVTTGAPALFPASSASVFRLGFLSTNEFPSKASIWSVSYVTNYGAWDGADGALPSAGSAPMNFSLEATGTGSSAMADGALTLVKSDKTPATKRIYRLPEPIDQTSGIMVECSLKVPRLTDAAGTPFPTYLNTGVGFQLVLADKLLDLRLVTSGVVGGHRIGIIPGSGSEYDLLSLTELGKRFSCVAPWSEAFVDLRLMYRYRNFIEVWVGSTAVTPFLRIPWQDTLGGFDLPDFVGTPSVAFGHFSSSSTSTSLWRYFRVSTSNGFDASVQRTILPLHPSSFGGSAYLRTEF